MNSIFIMDNISNENLYKIRVFDDGNQKYQYMANEWTITSVNGSKVSLKNVNGRDVIHSISSWKLDTIYI
jgi:uncharacterized protein affecting Mg2+/Co2+ transport